MNDLNLTPHLRNLPASTSRFIQSVAALVVCVVGLVGFFLHHSEAR